MKTFLKWIGIILGSLILIVVLTGLFLYNKYIGFVDYPSGGVLTENQSKYDVVFYDLDLSVNSSEKSISGWTIIKIKTLADGLEKIELDLYKDLVVSDVQMNEVQQKFRRDEDKLWIDLAGPLAAGSLIDLKIVYQGQPMEAKFPPWRGGFNWSKDVNGDDWIGVSCEGEGAKIWFPCKDHPSDEPDSVALHITIPDPYYCASNGLLRSITSAKPGFKTFHWATNYPINNYNVNISIAKYEAVERKYETDQGAMMPVIFYVLPQDRKKADELADMAVDMLKVYRKYFGEYPFSKEKFGLAETDYLGMEHQTLNAYGNKFAYDVIAGNKFDELMLHEMGHEWWGNKVTANDWADTWIHEGICTFGEALYHLDKTGEKGYHEYMQSIKKRIKNKKPIIIKRHATTSESYHQDVYSKGAYLLHSLRYMLGDSVFFKTIKEFATDPAYTYQNRVITDDFMELVKKNSAVDYTKFLHTFLYTNELPEIRLRKSGEQEYEIVIPNIDYELPVDIKTDLGETRVVLGSRPLKIRSGMIPVIDEKDWYLKNVKNESL